MTAKSSYILVLSSVMVHFARALYRLVTVTFGLLTSESIATFTCRGRHADQI